MSVQGDLAERVERSWRAAGRDARDGIDAEAVEAAIELLDRGEVRVAQPDGDGAWTVNTWAKQAVLLYFRIRGLETTEAGPFEYHDRLPLKHGYEAQGVRVVPPATVRFGAHLEPGVVLMPSYVNIGAYIGSGTMVDTWATVGSCAQIGAGVHLSGGVGHPAPHLRRGRVRHAVHPGGEAAHRGRAPRQVEAERHPARARRQHVTGPRA